MLTKKQIQKAVRIGITAVLFVVLLVAEHAGFFSGWRWYVKLGCYLVPYLLIGYDVIGRAVYNIRHGEIFDENFLMLIATIGALGIGEYPEAVAVLLFYQVGELFQDYAVGKSRKSIADMMDIAPEYANRELDGTLEQVDPYEVKAGERIVILPGERVPLDGTVLSGESALDTAALTGEAMPRSVGPGEDVISGCVNGSGTLHVQVTKPYEDSTVSRILELVENASSRKANVEQFISRFAKVYTPAVTLAALCLALIPPLFFGGSFRVWIPRACTFLVVSCPCALVISVPLGFFGGIGAASQIGVLVKGSNYLELLSKMDTIVMDKTGTITRGTFGVTRVLPAVGTEQDLLELAAMGEGYSHHPIAVSVRNAYRGTVDLSRVRETKEEAGKGVVAVIDDQTVLLGNRALLAEHGIQAPVMEETGTVLFISKGDCYQGALVIEDEIKEGAKETIQELKQLGVRRCVMLTGDRARTGEAVAKAVGMDEVHCELLPGDKVSLVEDLLQKEEKGERLAFVGDGINDAPVLTRADIGIAMGSLGSDAAIEAADIVLMDDDIRKIAKAVKISRRTMTIVWENIVFALAVKAVILVLGALGIANMWLAVFGDVGVAVLAICNSMRTLAYRG